MKKTILSGILSVFTMSLLFAQAGIEELPQNSKDFIAKHFASETITYVEKEADILPWGNDDMYEVNFSSGLEIKFNKSGEVSGIDAAKNQSIPTEALPAEILTYLKANYKDAEIESWEIDGNDQDVELSNGLDLEFDINGKFLRVD